MKVLIGTKGLRISREMMRELFERDSSHFDTMLRSEWCKEDKDATAQELEDLYGEHAVITEFALHFFKNRSVAFRTDPWVIAQVEKDVTRVAAPGDEKGVKIVEIPDDVKWYLRTEDDGSESIHEEHRVWQ